MQVGLVNPNHLSYSDIDSSHRDIALPYLLRLQICLGIPIDGIFRESYRSYPFSSYLGIPTKEMFLAHLSFRHINVKFKN